MEKVSVIEVEGRAGTAGDTRAGVTLCPQEAIPGSGTAQWLYLKGVSTDAWRDPAIVDNPV